MISNLLALYRSISSLFWIPEGCTARLEAISRLLAHNAASVSASGHRKEMARAALLERLQAISQTARVLAADVPGLGRRFQVPSPASDQTLLTLGRRFAREAEPLSGFQTQGMPATFLADLNVLVESFEHALRDRGLGRGERRAARASTKAILSSARAAVRSLNAIVINHLLTRTPRNDSSRPAPVYSQSFPSFTSRGGEMDPGLAWTTRLC